ncbi:MAG: iron-containing alcohol dehydrogenase [Bradymonadia bacterium]
MSTRSISTENQHGVTVITGAGAEGALAKALAGEGAQRVMLVAMARHRDGADRLAEALGERAVGVFTTERPQVPVEIADAATAFADAHEVDWVVAHGGGTCVGIAKAVALNREVKIAAVPTTYAGSERTDIWGLSADGKKTTGRDSKVRPSIVAYDPELSVGLPLPMTLQSLLNALSHSVEALYAVERTPEAEEAARKSVPLIMQALETLPGLPHDLDARASALAGAGLAGVALSGASMALHHKLAHVLGGLGLPHAPTHAALLPYSLAFNGPGAPEAVVALQQLTGVEDVPGALFDVLKSADLPADLKTLGVTWDQLEVLMERALSKQYPNPRPLDADSLKALLADAWLGRRPSWSPKQVALPSITGPHSGLYASTLGAEIESAEQVVIAVHGRGSDAEAMTRRIMGIVDHEDGLSILAPQAAARSWYPKGFLVPPTENEPHLSSALAALDAAWAKARSHHRAEDITLVGFSQGACLLLGWLKSRPHRPGAVAAFSGASIPVEGDFGQLAGVPVYMGKSAEDSWIPQAAFDETVAALQVAGARVTTEVPPGAEHTITAADAAHFNTLIDTSLER